MFTCTQLLMTNVCFVHAHEDELWRVKRNTRFARSGVFSWTHLHMAKVGMDSPKIEQSALVLPSRALDCSSSWSTAMVS